MNYKKYIEKENINEGFFGDLFGMVAVGKQLKKMAETLPKVNKNNPDEYIETINDRINLGISLIEKGKMSEDAKDSMRKGFLGGVFGKLYSDLGKSGDELQKMFGWDKKLYLEMLKAHNNS